MIITVGRDSLQRAVESVLAQTLKPDIYIVVDDLEAIERVRDLYSNIARVLPTTGRVGPLQARDLGTEAVQNKYVAYLDDDDWWAEAKLEYQVAGLEARPAAAIGVTGAYFHRRQGQVSVIPLLPPDTYPTVATYVLSRKRVRFGESLLQSSCIMIQTRLAKQLRWTNSPFQAHEDWDFGIRACKNMTSLINYIDIPLVHIQQGSANSLSAGNQAAQSLQWIKAHLRDMSRRSAGDALVVLVIRHALKARLRSTVFRAIGLLWTNRSIPHFASLLLVVKGAAEGLRGIKKGSRLRGLRSA